MPQPPRPPPSPMGFYSNSTPNLPTVRSFEAVNSDLAIVTPTDHPSQHESVEAAPARQRQNAGKEFPLISGQPQFSPGDSGDEELSDGEEEDIPAPNLPTRTLYKHPFSRSHTYLGTPAFAPPFYNRPPTPLPPSPSLTSLLRPNFSSANSRPTTPDPSSDEGGTPGPHPTMAGEATGSQTPNSAAASTLTNTYRTAKPQPRASPRVPTYEYYGFTLYLTSSLGFIVYLFWAYLPKPFLLQLGIYYFPDRWWALAIPAWTVSFIVYIYVALATYNSGYLTLSLNNLECLVDEAAYLATVDAHGKIVHEHQPGRVRGTKGEGKGRSKGKLAPQQSRKSSLSSLRAAAMQQELDWQSLWNEGTDAVMDIPVGGVCEILYGGVHDDSGDDEVMGNANDR